MNNVVTISKRLEWDSAHRVLMHESKCSTLHGHRYAAVITCCAPQLDSVGRVIDFGVIKRLVGEWIDTRWDHTTLVNSADEALLEFVTMEADTRGKRDPYVFNAEPTAEVIALELLRVSRQLLKPHGVTVLRVDVYETPTSMATAT